jgi:hypothetical protein
VKLDRQILPRTRWFFDYDGSLCPHQEVWEERNYRTDEILNCLLRLAKVCDGVFWNTGRRVESLASVNTSFLDFPGYFVQGSVFWDAKNSESRQLGPSLPRACAEAFTEALRSDTDLRLEIKTTGLRIAPLTAAAFNRLKPFLSAHDSLRPRHWNWIVGHRGAELLADDWDKGTSIRREVEGHPSIPVGVGDDLLDRPAAEEVLRRGGFMIMVGEGCGWVTEVPHRPWQLIYCDKPANVHTLIRKLT